MRTLIYIPFCLAAAYIFMRGFLGIAYQVCNGLLLLMGGELIDEEPANPNEKPQPVSNIPVDPSDVTTVGPSDTATILAALRMFQEKYQNCGQAVIYEDWPLYFGANVEPLASKDIDRLCDVIMAEQKVKA